jgi:hypothetical protein
VSHDESCEKAETCSMYSVKIQLCLTVRSFVCVFIQVKLPATGLNKPMGDPVG